MDFDYLKQKRILLVDDEQELLTRYRMLPSVAKRHIINEINQIGWLCRQISKTGS